MSVNATLYFLNSLREPIPNMRECHKLSIEAHPQNTLDPGSIYNHQTTHTRDDRVLAQLHLHERIRFIRTDSLSTSPRAATRLAYFVYSRFTYMRASLNALYVPVLM